MRVIASLGALFDLSTAQPKRIIRVDLIYHETGERHLNRTGLRLDLLLLVGLLLLLTVFFWPVALGDKTLLPVDNLFAWQPWESFAPELGVGVPHNGLLSDLILENYVWKRFIVQSIGNRSIPLWNPNILAGVPFLAAGQHSAMYPLSLVFYVLPLARAYGVFTLLQLWLAGAFMYIYLRTIRVGRFGSLVAGITYALSGFFITRVVFTMIVAAIVVRREVDVSAIKDCTNVPVRITTHSVIARVIRSPG